MADKNQNKDNLEGLQCPKCGEHNSLKIECNCTVTVWDDVVGDPTGFNWSNDHSCECPKCHFHGIVEDFTMPFQDALHAYVTGQ